MRLPKIRGRRDDETADAAEETTEPVPLPEDAETVDEPPAEDAGESAGDSASETGGEETTEPVPLADEAKDEAEADPDVADEAAAESATEASDGAAAEPTPPRPAKVRSAEEEFRRRRRRRRIRRLLPWAAAVLVVLVVGGGIWLVGFSSYLAAKKVAVSGTARVSHARVERAARVPIGRPLARVDLEAIRKRVEQIREVRSARVSRAWPDSVRIAVTERTPVAVVDQGSGLQALDETGHTFAGFKQRPARLPLVKSTDKVTTAALAEAGRVAGSMTRPMLAKIDYIDVVTVDQITLYLKDGRTVAWGNSSSSAEKARVAAVLLRKPVRQVDVSVPGRPTTRG